jgi:hypothetical protein
MFYNYSFVCYQQLKQGLETRIRGFLAIMATPKVLFNFSNLYVQSIQPREQCSLRLILSYTGQYSGFSARISS